MSPARVFVSFASVLGLAASVHPCQGAGRFTSEDNTAAEAALTKGSRKADVVRFVPAPRVAELTRKLREAVQDDPDKLAAVLGNRYPDGTLRYDEALGLTRIEYAELLAIQGRVAMRRTGSVSFDVRKRKNRWTAISTGGEIPALDAVTFSPGTLMAGRKMVMKGDPKAEFSLPTGRPLERAAPFGSWTGLSWQAAAWQKKKFTGGFVAGRLESGQYLIGVSLGPPLEAEGENQAEPEEGTTSVESVLYDKRLEYYRLQYDKSLSSGAGQAGQTEPSRQQSERAEEPGESEGSQDVFVVWPTYEELGLKAPDGAQDFGPVETPRDVFRQFRTSLVGDHTKGEAPPEPPAGVAVRTKYPSPAGDLWAYVTPVPSGAPKAGAPAVVWISGGDVNSIDDTFFQHATSDNDQTAQAFRRAGVVTMYPSLRGGNNNPGRREGFLGEVDDVLAAADWLAEQPGIDPDRIYLAGHSTGGTLVLMTAPFSEDRFKAIFAFGGVAMPATYGAGQPWLPIDVKDPKELHFRSPIQWLPLTKTRTFVIEGMNAPSNAGDVDTLRKEIGLRGAVRFVKVRGVDHFSVLGPATREIARRISQNGEMKFYSRQLQPRR